MTAQYAGWFPTVTAAVAMLFLGMRLRLLTPPQLTTRCGACRRLVRRGRTCPCTRVSSS